MPNGGSERKRRSANTHGAFTEDLLREENPVRGARFLARLAALGILPGHEKRVGAARWWQTSRRERAVQRGAPFRLAPGRDAIYAELTREPVWRCGMPN